MVIRRKFKIGQKKFSEEDVQMLVGMGVDEQKARRVLGECGGQLDAAMDAAFS